MSDNKPEQFTFIDQDELQKAIQRVELALHKARLDVKEKRAILKNLRSFVTEEKQPDE